MPKSILTLILIGLASGAFAHPGHLIEQAGHNHWLAGAAIGLAILLGIRGALKGKGSQEAKAEEPEQEPEGEAA